MSKPFAAFDIDGTLFRSSLIVEFVETAIDNHIFPSDARDNYIHEYNAWKQREHPHAYEDYIDNVVAVFLRNVAGKREGEVSKMGKELAEKIHRETYVYTRELVQQLNKTHFTIAISGSNVEFLEPFVKNYGFDLWYGSQLAVADGKYTGKDLKKGHHNKDLTLKEIVKEHDLSYAGSIAVGDTAPDIPMLELAETPIAFNPSRDLFDHARSAKWNIVVERKNMIYRFGEEDGKYVLENE